MPDYQTLLDRVEAAFEEVASALRVASAFHHATRNHFSQLVAIARSNPDWPITALPMAMLSGSSTTPRQQALLLAASICHFASLDALDDAQDQELSGPKWHEFSDAMVINLGGCLQVVSLAAFRQAGCSSGFLNDMLETVLGTYAGQALDLALDPNSWRTMSEDQYLDIASRKSGNTTRIIAGAACDLACVEKATCGEVVAWSGQLGQFIQVLSDQAEMRSPDYSRDLDQGKLSLPLVYFAATQDEASIAELALLLERCRLSKDKADVMRALRQSGAFTYSDLTLRRMRQSLQDRLQTPELTPFESRLSPLVPQASLPI